MSNWIEEEGKKHQAEKEAEIRKQEFTMNSEHWSKLKQQIAQDVDYINQKSVWKDFLVSNFIEIIDLDSNVSYKIRHTLIPAVYIMISNKSETIEIKTKIREEVAGDYKENEESWIVISDSDDVYLKNGFTHLPIPHKASEYILKPIIEALKRIKPINRGN